MQYSHGDRIAPRLEMDMAARPIILATALLLGLPGLAQAQARSTWQEPERRAADAPAPRQQEAQAAPRDVGPPPRQDAEAPPPPAARQAEAPRRPTARAQQPREVKSARYRGGAGSTWRTGRDSHGFAGSYGGCSYRGFAGPNGYKLNRSC